MDEPKLFPSRLLQARTDKGLTQAALAERAGLPAAAVSHFETGFRFPTAATLGKLADALGVTVDYLLGREEEVGPKVQPLFRKLSKLNPEALRQLDDFAEFLQRKHEQKKDDPKKE